LRNFVICSHGRGKSCQAFSELVVARSETLRRKLQALRASRQFGQRSRPAFLAARVMPVDAFKIRNSLYLTVGALVCARPSATIAAIVSFCAANDEVPCARLACFVGLPVATLYVSLHVLPPQLL